MVNPGTLQGLQRVLFILKGANMNSTADQIFIPYLQVPASYIITAIYAANASISLTLAAGGIYTGAAKTGNILVAATQTYATLTVPSAYSSLTLATSASGTVQTAIPILSLTTGQGVASTADFRIIGIDNP